MINLFQTTHKPCPTCGGAVYGRSDKRFCTVKCKNKHHAGARAQIRTRFSYVEKKLHRNYVILEGILGPKHNCMTVHKDDLFKHGFNFTKCTNKFKDNKRTYSELIDYQYTVSTDGMVVVRRMNPLTHSEPGFFERWEIDFPNKEPVFGDFVGEFAKKFCRW